jgi:DNA polymerase III subunit gamma/tau
VPPTPLTAPVPKPAPTAPAEGGHKPPLQPKPPANTPALGHIAVLAPTTEKPAAPIAPKVTTAAVETAWTYAVEKFATERALEADTIRAVTFHASKADQIEVLVPKALEKKIHYLRSPRNLEVLENALQEKLGTRLQIVYLIGEPANGATLGPATPITTATSSGKPTPPPPNMSQEAFLDDPVIQNALKIFEAKIVSPANK